MRSTKTMASVRKMAHSARRTSAPLNTGTPTMGWAISSASGFDTDAR